MQIFEQTPLGGRDFEAIMKCEHCDHKQKLTSGYEDNHYHSKVIPAMTCGGCGKNRAGYVPIASNNNGTEHVPQ